MKHDIKRIAGAFAFEGAFSTAQAYGAGHINDTYRALYSENGRKRNYIVQRINHEVFKNPVAMMDNIVRVTQHIEQRIAEEEQAGGSPKRQSLRLVPTHEGASYHQDDAGNYWRAYDFIESTFTLDTLGTDKEVYEAARAFAAFQRMLTDLPGPPLTDTIPHFHDGPYRLDAFHEALEADSHNRAAQAGKEIAFLVKHAKTFEVLPDLVAKGAIPVRTTHNDTKVNNVLLDMVTRQGVCVIDLDTVMPGLALYDFGDLVRTTITAAEEDEQNLDKVTISPHRYEAALKGYLTEAEGFLNAAEIDHLPFSGRMMTLMIGTRFLTDFLNGDTYFKTRRPGHNLDRARVQFKIVQRMLELDENLREITERHRR